MELGRRLMEMVDNNKRRLDNSVRLFITTPYPLILLIITQASYYFLMHLNNRHNSGNPELTIFFSLLLFQTRNSLIST